MSNLISYRIAVFIGLLLFSISSWGASGLFITFSGPDYATGFYQESSTDLSVKVTGGYIQVTRSWSDGQWRFNRGAQGAILTYGREHDSIPQSIDIGGAEYTLDPASVNASAEAGAPQARYFNEQSEGSLEVGSEIVKTDNGYDWSDESGNWMSYDSEGQLLEGGDRNTVITKTVRDAQNRVFQILDAHDNLVMTYEYAGIDSDKITKVEDYSGRSVSYTWSGERLTSVTDVRGEQWTYEYAVDGNLSKRIDPAGNMQSMSYVSGVLTKLTSPLGLSTSFTYDFDEVRQRYYIRAEDASGKIDEKWYKQSGLLLEHKIDGVLVSSTSEASDTSTTTRTVTRKGGTSVTQVFNSDGKLIRVTHPDGSLESAEYLGPYHKVSRHVDARGEVTEFEYDSNGNLIKVTEGVGTALQREMQFEYDSYGQRIRIYYPSDALTQAASYRVTYDVHGNKASIKDPNGKTTSYAYQVTGRLFSAQTPIGFITQATYDAAGNVLSVTDPLERAYTAEYDAVGNRTKVIYPNGLKASFGYDAVGRVVSQKVLSSAGEELTSSSVAFDDIDRQITATDALGYTSEKRYNVLGQLVSSKNRAGEVTEAHYKNGILESLDLPTYDQYFTYDLKGQPVANTLVWGNSDEERLTQSQVTNAYGQITQSVDGNGNAQVRNYDIFGRPTSMVDALGGVTALKYDSRNNLIQVTDAEGRITKFEYDKLNRKVAEIKEPAPGVINKRRYAYDPDGRMIRELSPSGHLRQYNYDKTNQIIRIRYYNSETLEGVNPAWWAYNWSDLKDLEVEHSASFYYNDMGQMTQLVENEFSQDYEYTDLGQVSEISTTYPNGMTKVQAYTYDQRGQKTSYTNPEGITYRYTYTPNGEIETLAIPGEGVVSYRGYQSGKASSILFPGGSRQEMTYDGLGRLTSKEMLDPAGDSIGNMAFTYDKAHNILSIQREFGLLTYGYDSLYRLTSAIHPVLDDEVYQYDLVHNRTQRTLIHSDGSETTDDWNYNGANQLTGYSNVSFGYNADGHTIRKSVCSTDVQGQQSCEHEYYIYDARERMVAVERQVDRESKVVVAEYKYNALGWRFEKRVNGSSEFFLYDQTGLVGEYDPFGTLLSEYHFTPSLEFMGYPLFVRRNDVVGYYVNDHLGTGKIIVSSNGNKLWFDMASAFGVRLTNSGGFGNKLGFAGQYYDAEIMSYYNIHRDYVGEVGRYRQADPLGLKAGPNYYSYVYSNPLVYVDPYGLFSVVIDASGSGVPGVGGGVSTGAYMTFDDSILSVDTENWTITDNNAHIMDVGIVNSAWGAGGFEMSYGVSVTLMEGGRENLEGTTITEVFDLFILAGEIHMNPTTREVVGISFGWDAVPLPGNAVRVAQSEVYSIWDYISLQLGCSD